MAIESSKRSWFGEHGPRRWRGLSQMNPAVPPDNVSFAKPCW
jgi:hypothetical protein